MLKVSVSGVKRRFALFSLPCYHFRYHAPPYTVGGVKRYRDLSVCLSVCLSVRLCVPRCSRLGYRHAGCLQLSHRRPQEMCGLRTHPRTDVDPPRFLPPSNCHRRGVGISSRGSRGDTLSTVMCCNSVYYEFTDCLMRWRWLGSRVVSVLDSGAEGPGFKSQPRRCRVTVLGKLFTPIVPLFAKQQNW